MTEELKALLQADTNLRDALRMDEAERPQMPADLNERLMQRVTDTEKKRSRIIWPWIAAACVAGVMMIWLMLPKEQTPSVAKKIPSPAIQTTSPNGKGVVSLEAEKVEEPVVAKVETKTASQRTPRDKKIRNTQITPTTQAAEPTTDLAAVQEKEVSSSLPSRGGIEGGGSNGSVVTLTERDIPITRPENLKHTPEELALLKKQAAEAYLKWVELELEISKYNLEQASLK